MTLLNLAWKSLRNRRATTWLTVLSIALSVMLLLSVEKARKAAEDGFTQSISQVDLIVGARSGPVQLILFTVFNIGNPTHNVSFESFEHWSQHPAVEWTIPYSLGDGHRGFRVVGTNENFFKHYRFRGDQSVEFLEGRPFESLWDVVIGADVYRELNYKLNDPIVVAHGVTRGEGVVHHEGTPFHIVGIMKPTGTPLDRAVYISLKGMEALHYGWETGAPPRDGGAVKNIPEEQLKVKAITSFFVRTKSRIETLGLQRQINEYQEEPLLAIIPGATLAELWNTLSYVETVLKIISYLVILVGFFAMLISLLTTLNERRREMSILRALGASPGDIFFLLVFESSLLSFLGAASGTFIVLGVQWIGEDWISSQSGLYFMGPPLDGTQAFYLLGIWLGGTLIGIFPALRAFQNSLKDGLSIKI